MNLEILPDRSGRAAENMAIDFLLLLRYPRPEAARFRHYGWHAPAFTFGYSQKIENVRAQLPSGERLDLCRRATGGGLVDHRDDWTYALVIPRGHALEEARATQSYRIVHECLAAALQAQGVAAGVEARGPAPNDPRRAQETGGRPLRRLLCQIGTLRRRQSGHGRENRRRRPETKQARAPLSGFDLEAGGGGRALGAISRGFQRAPRRGAGRGGRADVLARSQRG